MDRSCRNEQQLASLERHGRCALDRILSYAVDHIDDLFIRMRARSGSHSRRKFDDHLDDLASGNAEIMPL
jgi:hypothetical protein